MRSRIAAVVLATGLLFSVFTLLSKLGAFRLPGNQQDYEPLQPIAYSHRLHAGELQIACLYCHFGAEKSRHAGIPPANVCMNCHKVVRASFGAFRAGGPNVVSPELAKLYTAFKTDAPVQWTKVHNLPDFVYFDHRPHVGAGVACQKCHGPMETMERVRQASNLSMGWCVNCHRDSRASIDCAVCHF